MARRGSRPEQLEERIIAVGEPAVRRAAEDGVTLGIDKRLVARLALVEPGVERGGGGQRLLEPPARRFELRRLAVEKLGALPRDDEFVQQKAQHDRDEHGEEARRHQRKAVVQHDIAERDEQKRERNQSRQSAKCAQTAVPVLGP
ncbi:MAG: hypothetical protein WDM81_00065 [Rhizomicrobium sp.]